MPLDPLQIAVFLVLGAAFGALGGLFGIGGGLVAIPVLGIVFGLDEQHAQGTALVLVAPNMFLALWKYIRRGGIDPRVAIALAVAGVPMTFAGAHIATQSGPWLRLAFACFLAALALSLLWRARIARPPAVPVARPLWLAALVGGIGGTISGIFGVGGAYVAVPVLTQYFGYAQTVAQGLALAFVAPGALVGLAEYSHAGDVVWPTGIALALGGIFAVGPGVALAHRLPERRLQQLFCVVLLVAAGALVRR